MNRWPVIALLILLLSGCAPPQPAAPQVQRLPTRFPTVTPEYNNAEAAELVIRTFLDAWDELDYETMYGLLSVPSQQATQYETFVNLYENTHTEMRLAALGHRILAQARESNRVMVFNYEVTFESDIVGEFTDTNREIRLLMDDELQQWRVAWSPGDIFPEIGNGGSLRLTTFQPPRANIYDSEGRILANMEGVMVSVNVIPQQIPNRAACISTLAQVLDEQPEDIAARVDRFSDNQLGEVDLIDAAAFRQWEEQLTANCAAQFERRATRLYTEGELMAHLVGYVGYPEENEIPALEEAGFTQDTIIGRNGVERSWDETLRGQPGGQLTVVNADGEVVRLLADTGSSPPQSVYLTVDRELQRFALQVIQTAYERNAEGWGQTSDGAALVMLDVNTGAILSMVSYPTFDANAFTTFPQMGEEAAQQIITDAKEDPRRPLVNRVTQGTYPTGSTMKTITSVAALDSGVYTRSETYTSIGVWNRDIPRYDWRDGGHGTLNLAQALTHSCNTCFYEAGYRLDQADPYLFSDYARLMGLGVPTGIQDLQEEAGLIGNPDNKIDYESPVPWNFSDAVSIAIGQGGVSVTPLQLLRAYTAVANGGTLYRPQLVDRAGLLDEYSYQMQPDPMADIGVSEIDLEYLRDGLCDVTSASFGTAEFVFRDSPLQSVGVCGKTGTATAGDGSGSPHAWFVAYAPRENPQVAIVVMVENAGEGSGVAAPIVREVLEYYYFQDVEIR